MAYANKFVPMGFRPRFMAGRTNPITKQRPVAATRSAVGNAASAALAKGDAYAIDASGNAIAVGPGGVVRGVIIGFKMNAIPTVMGGAGPISQDYLPATDAGNIIGIEDPDASFLVQTDTLAAANIGQTFDITAAAPDATLRQSRESLNVGAGTANQFTVIELDATTADNAYGANAKAVVRLAQSFE